MNVKIVGRGLVGEMELLPEFKYSGETLIILEHHKNQSPLDINESLHNKLAHDAFLGASAILKILLCCINLILTF